MTEAIHALEAVYGTPYTTSQGGMITAAVDAGQVLADRHHRDGVVTRYPIGRIAGGASSQSATSARLRAMLEAAEREGALITDLDAGERHRHDELGVDGLDPSQIPRHATSELGVRLGRQRILSSSDRIRWTPGRSLLSGRQILVPAVMVGIAPPVDEFDRFWLPTTVGLAAQLTEHEAIDHAVHELVERDAVALAWLQRWGAISAMTLTGRDGATQGLGDRVRAYDLSLFPSQSTVLATVETPRSALRIVCGCASRPGFDDALEHAVEEARQFRAVLLRMIRSGHPIPENEFDCTRVEDGALFAGARVGASAFSFLTEAASPRPSHDSGGLSLREHLLARGFDILVIDITPPRLRDIGVVVVRAVIPSLQPWSFRHDARYLDSQRMRSLGLASGGAAPYALA